MAGIWGAALGGPGGPSDRAGLGTRWVVSLLGLGQSRGGRALRLLYSPGLWDPVWGPAGLVALPDLGC